LRNLSGVEQKASRIDLELLGRALPGVEIQPWRRSHTSALRERFDVPCAPLARYRPGLSTHEPPPILRAMDALARPQPDGVTRTAHHRRFAEARRPECE